MAEEEEKTEEPTGKKISKAKGQGNVPKSAEVVGAAILLFGTVYLLFWADFTYSKIKASMVYTYDLIDQELSTTVLYNAVYTLSYELLLSLLPFFGLVLFLGIVLNVAQFGFLVNPLKFNLGRLNPISGLKGIFSFKKLLEGLKLLAKLTLLVVVMLIIFGITYEAFLAMMDKSMGEAIESMFEVLLYFIFAILLIIIIFAIIDLVFIRYYYFKSLRMSKQEIKDEHKNAEGDPRVKARIRKIQFEMHKKRMMSNVQDADVVVTNPTHYAVALKYDMDVDSAPKVVAKGIDFLALKIKDIAKENDIPIIENPSLARALHDQIEVDENVPEEFYKALAEVFSYVYELNKNKR